MNWRPVPNPMDGASLFPQGVFGRQPITANPARDTSGQLLAICTEKIPPGEEGKARLIFPDMDDSDPILNRKLRSLSGENNEIRVVDMNGNNYILKDELFYVTFDADFGDFVPVGSQGTVRRAIASEDHFYYGSGAGSNVFEAEVQGSSESVTLFDVSNAWCAEPVYDGEKIWVVWLSGDQAPEGDREQRRGQWYRIQRIPGDLKIFKAPSGGIPAAVNTLMGYVANCAVYERVPNTHNLRVATSAETITVENWSSNIVCKDGYRFGIAAWMLGCWMVIAESCQATGGGTGGAGSGVGSISLSISMNPLDQDDFSEGAGLSQPIFINITMGTFDPDLEDYYDYGAVPS